MEMELYFRAELRPDGSAAWGYLVRAPGLEGLAECGTLPGPGVPQGRADYVALGKALRFLSDGRKSGSLPFKAGDRLSVRGSSRLVVEQLNGRWESKAPELRPLLARCRELLGGLGYEWHPERVSAEAVATVAMPAAEPAKREVAGEGEKLGRDKPAKCRWCDAACEFLCDRPTDDGKGTCDAPMCGAHRRNVGSMHVDYRDKQGRRKGDWHSVDHCPDCVAREKGPAVAVPAAAKAPPADVFVAIDFETADAQRDSACAVGLCRVEGGRVVYRDVQLIRPPRPKVTTTFVHGLTWERLRGQPPFAQVWPKLAPILEGAGRLAAHNAAFDRSVLEACCKAAGLDVPRHAWVCTLERSRARWPKPHSNKLPDVCARLGVTIDRHHEAGSDAEACARVLLALESPPAGGDRPAAVTEDAALAAVLAQLPEAWRSDPAVRRLSADAAADPALAPHLVAWVRANFERLHPPGPRCRCGKRVWLLGDTCWDCHEREVSGAEVPGRG